MAVRASMCRGCGLFYYSLQQHFGTRQGKDCFANFYSGQTDPVQHVRAEMPPTKRVRTSTEEDKQRTAVGLAKLIVEKNVSYAAVGDMVDLMRSSRREMDIEEKEDVLRGLDTQHKQINYIKDKIRGYVEPRMIYLGLRPSAYVDEAGTEYVYKETQSYAVTLDLVEQVTNMLHHPVAGPEIMKASEGWSIGTKNMTQPHCISDIFHGKAFLEHEMLREPWDSEEVVVAVLLFGGDEIQTTSPLGLARGNDKLFPLPFTYVNLPVRVMA